MKDSFLCGNDMFSLLNYNDLNDILSYCSDYMLEYRDSLELDKDISFGIEIEYENLLRKNVDKYIYNRHNDWLSKLDGSLLRGGEITSPIMKDDVSYWNDLKKICDYLKRKKVTTIGKTGGHIHVGASYLNKDIESWIIFLKLYVSYEHILYRFSFGDKISGRDCIDVYAKSVSERLISFFTRVSDIDNIFEFIKCLPRNNRNYSINFKNVSCYYVDKNVCGNTIEFRLPNSSVNEIIWQNNINTFCKMMMSSKKKVIDEEFLNYKIKNDYISYYDNKLRYYNVDLKNSLEFVDLVFNNNKDKLYFLRQYLKNYQLNYGYNSSIKSKRFTK